MSDYRADLELALELADRADAISLARYRALDLIIETKPDLTPVTDADKAVEQALRDHLRLNRADDAIVGEEFGSSGAARRKWIIDPIDGTANFVRGVPIWATLIALSVDAHPTVSVVSAPAMGLRWWAAEGSGAFARDIDGGVRKLTVSKVGQVSDASISYNSLQLWQQSEFLNGLLELSAKVWRTRAFGDFYSYMLLAEGAIDVVAEHDLKIYDIAALVPIVEQAGGQFSSLEGELTESSSSILASNSLLHEKIRQALMGS
ncbi:MAG: inositol monophosphatase family protein [Actinomycetota bacterium]